MAIAMTRVKIRLTEAWFVGVPLRQSSEIHPPQGVEVECGLEAEASGQLDVPRQILL